MSLDHPHFMNIALELSRQTAARGNRPLCSLLVIAF